MDEIADNDIDSWLASDLGLAQSESDVLTPEEEAGRAGDAFSSREATTAQPPPAGRSAPVSNSRGTSNNRGARLATDMTAALRAAHQRRAARRARDGTNARPAGPVRPAAAPAGSFPFPCGFKTSLGRLLKLHRSTCPPGGCRGDIGRAAALALASALSGEHASSHKCLHCGSAVPRADLAAHLEGAHGSSVAEYARNVGMWALDL